MRYILGGFLILHGVAHLVGFVVPWKLVQVEDSPYKTTLLSGRWDVGGNGIRVVGILWLLGALAFVAAGAGLLAGFAWWADTTIYATIGSLLLSVLGWPDSRIGAVINVLLLLFLRFGGNLGLPPLMP
jgi:hypothetical protein